MNIREEALSKYFVSVGEKYPEEYKPYYNLWTEVIKKAITHRDVDFFVSSRSAHICELLDLDIHALRKALPEDMAEEVKEGLLCKTN